MFFHGRHGHAAERFFHDDPDDDEFFDPHRPPPPAEPGHGRRRGRPGPPPPPPPHDDFEHHHHHHPPPPPLGRRFFRREGPPPPRPFGPPPRGRVFGPGDLRLLILHLIGEQPRHGYEVIKAIEEQFAGAYAPSPGAVYPILNYLQDQDFIVEDPGGKSGKRLYSITETGRAHLEDNQLILDGILTRVGIHAQALEQEGPPESIFQAMQVFRHALAVHRGPWNPAEVARVSKIILQAARQIARLEETT